MNPTTTTTTEHLANFNIAGFTYYSGAECFSKLKMGAELTLQLEPENKYDPRAVAVYYKNHKLGFVPKSDNRIIFKLLKVGLGHFLKARIQRIDATDHPESQIQVVVHLNTDNGEKTYD